MKKRVISMLLCSAVAVSLFAGCGSSASTSSSSGSADTTEAASEATSETADAAAEDEPITIKLGSVGSGSEFDELNYACSAFVDAVEDLSNGSITVEYYPNGQLGGEDSMLDQIMTGSLDCACLSGSICTTVWPDFTVYTLPFAYDSIDTFWEIDRKGAFDYLEDVTRESGNGAVWLGSFACTFRGFSNTEHEVRTAADMAGLQTRVVSGEVFTDIFRSLGTNTATIAYAELYSALQQGVVNSEDNGIVTCYDRKFYEIEKYHTQINMIPNVNSFIISEETLDKMSDNQVSIIRQAIEVAEDNHHEAVNNLIQDVAQKLEDEGMQVTLRDELTDDEMQTFYDCTQPVWDKYAAVIDEDFYNNWMEIRSEVQGD